MDLQHLVRVLTQQRNAAMDNVALLAVERDLLKERVFELEKQLSEKEAAA